MAGDEEVQITLTLRQAATMALIATSHLTQIFYGGMKEPVTGTPVSMETAADIAEIVERVNVAVGNEPSIEVREFIYKLREKDKSL